MIMAAQNMDPSALSAEDKADIDVMNVARQKQVEAGKLKDAALAGHQPPPDPNAPPPNQHQAPELTTPGQINQSQQADISSADLARKRDMDAQMAATRAGVPAYAPGSTIDIAQSAATAPQAVQNGVQATTKAVSGIFEVWRASQPGSLEKAVYAADWKSLRDILKGEDGEWLAVHHQFPADVPSILGFFQELVSSYDPISGTEAEKFDVIVKGNKIFRSEIDPEPAAEEAPAEASPAAEEAPAEASPAAEEAPAKET